MLGDTAPQANAASSELKEGDRFGGRYVLGTPIARGGMGAVWRARDTDRDRDVAIKVMLAGDEDTVARFVREAQVASSLGSEHIVEVLDVGELVDGTPYIVMELLTGMGFDRLVSCAPHDEAFVCELVIQACAGVAQAHRHHIIHRDLKPSNLWMAQRSDGSPLVKVLDFGLARRVSRLPTTSDAPSITRTGATLGTPGYMSPEQLRSARRADERSDIWALGHVLFRLLTGERAFEAEDEGAYYAMILTEAPSSPRRHRPTLSAALEHVVLRCLEREPADRYQSCDELASALRPFTDDAPSFSAIRAALVEAASTSSRHGAPAQLAANEVSTITSPDRDTVSSPEAERPRALASRWLPVAAGALLVVAAGAGLALGFGKTPASAEPVASAPPAAASRAESPAASTPPVGSATSTAKTVSVSLDITPPNAEVRVDGQVTRDNPVRISADGREHRLDLSAPGHAPETRNVVADRDLTVTLKLRRLDGRARVLPPTPPVPATSTAAAAPPHETKPPSILHKNVE